MLNTSFPCLSLLSPQTLISRFHTLSLYPLLPMSSLSAAKVVAEYAKSSRSSCKGCGKPIASGSLRLGLSSKDPRGFDLVKWHHLDCFPPKSCPLTPSKEIKGFSSLKPMVLVNTFEPSRLLSSIDDLELVQPIPTR